MKKKLIIVLTAMSLLGACTPESRTCTINGIIDDANQRNGELIFLVPIGPHVDADVDSTVIRDGKFTFHPDSEMVAVLRVHRRSRIGLQDLLVVTEPGTVNATVAEISSCSGTPQNDSLQVWKDLPRDSNFRTRSTLLAWNLGDCILGRWLQNMFPEKDDL